MSTDEFDVGVFENELISLKDTQEGIQQMSSWCLKHRVHHKKIVSSWLNVLKQVRVEHRLILFYLANDVIQYSKRKSYEFVDSWGTALQKATTMVRDEKVRIKIVRIFKIWKEREIYSDEYLSDLNGLLNMNPIKKNTHQCQDNNDDFQNSILISRLFECSRLSAETDKNFIKLSNPPSCDLESIKNTLKDKSHTEDMEKDIQKFSKTLESYIKSLQSEMTSRKLLICNIEQADSFYSNQRGEVKVVVNAYKNFGGRIRNVKKKLEEVSMKLPSPIPSPDLDAPSPEPDADINLPEDSLSSHLFKTSNGYVSYMDGNLPFDINDFKSESNKSLLDGTQAIEVIHSRSEENPANDYEDSNFFKSLGHKHFPYSGNRTPPPSLSQELNYEMSKAYSPGQHSYDNRPNTYNPSYPDNTSYSARFSTRNYQRPAPLIPPPPIPATLVAQTTEFNNSWNSEQTWVSNTLFESHLDTPVSPPHFEREGINSNIIEYMERESGIAIQDVDHRQLSHPPANSSKVHTFSENGRPIDVDHRNLISLTGSPGSKPSKSDANTMFREKDNCSMYEDHKLSLDIDYRNHCLGDGPHKNTEADSQKLKPPPFPPLLESPPTVKKSKTKSFSFLGNKTKSIQQYLINDLEKSSTQEDSDNDNIEAIDMEMSDDEFDDDHFRDDDKEEVEDCDKPDSSSTSPVDMGQSQPRMSGNEPAWNHHAESNQLNNDGNNAWRNQKMSLLNYNHPENHQQPEYRRFFNPAGRIMQQKNNFQIQSKSRGSPYFNRGYNTPLRGGNMNNRRGHFRGRQWK